MSVLNSGGMKKQLKLHNTELRPLRFVAGGAEELGHVLSEASYYS